MKLREFHVREFWSIWDSNPIRVDDRVTCLVGKNESGKTALLKALYRTNPINSQDGSFDTTFDYPKRDVGDYLQETQDGTREPVVVVSALYELEEEDRQAIAAVLGPDSMKNSEVQISTYYDNRQPSSVSRPTRARLVGTPPQGQNCLPLWQRSFTEPIAGKTS